MRCALVLVGCFVAFAAQGAECSQSAEPGRDWSGCNRRNLMLPGSNLRGAVLAGTDFSRTDLRRAMLTEADLSDAKLASATLAGAAADNANFTKIEGYRSDFRDISAKGASFRGAELQRAEFADAALNGANFEKAELGRADFTGATLAGSSFAYAILARADLAKAHIEGPLDFSNAYTFLTRIQGADLRQATGLTQAQVDLACGDADTRLPPGLSASKNWPCGAE